MMQKSFKRLLMKDLEPHFMQKVYVWKGIMFVPHYESPCYVGPGYGIKTVRVFSEEELMEMGAAYQMYPLWAGGTNRSQANLEKKRGNKKQTS